MLLILVLGFGGHARGTSEIYSQKSYEYIFVFGTEENIWICGGNVTGL